MIVSWTAFKNFVNSKSLNIQWIEDETTYFLKAFDGAFYLECILNKSNHNDYLTDFETNFKPSGNIKLLGQKTSTNSTPVTIASDQSSIPIILKGGSDATTIGNTGDKLKVEASFSSSQRVTPSYIGTAVRFDDMNVSHGGVARDTSITSTVNYTQLYSYTGSGQLFAFTVSFEGNLIGSDPFNIKLEIDGITCFEINTLDLGTSTFWNLSNIGDERSMGLSLTGNTMRFSQKDGGLHYQTSIKIYIKKAAGGSKRFRGGMVYLTKES